MRRLFLHIGYPKTGTTALQAFLAANGAALAAQGVLYPSAGRLHRYGRLDDAHYGASFAMGLGAWDRPADVAIPEGVGAAIAAEAAAAGAERVVVSSEYFATAGPAERARVQAEFADFEMRIVCYLRRHDDALESAYAQAVKTVADPPWGASVEGYVVHELGMGTFSYDYLGVLRQWAHSFGTPAITVRPYERAQNQPDIAADFLRVIGVEDGPGFVRPPRANPSIGPRTAAAIQLVRRTGLAPAEKQWVVGQLIAADALAPSDAHYLTAVLRESLVRRHWPMYRVIAREFMGSDEPLFTAPRPDGIDDLRRDDMSPEALLETVLRPFLPRGEA